MTTRHEGVRPVALRSALAAFAALVLSAALGCSPREWTSGREVPQAPPLAPDATPEPAPDDPAAPFALRRAVCLTDGPGEIAFVGDAGRAARDVVLPARDSAMPPRLVVVADPALGSAHDDEIRARMAQGALLYVDDWGGDAEHLLRFTPGGTLRDLRADEPPLAGPHELGEVPTAHAGAHKAGAKRLVGVEVDGCVRVVATEQDTLCHGCACSALPGRRAFAENLVAFASVTTARLAPSAAERPVRIRDAHVAGARLAVSADFRAPDRPADLRLEFQALDGRVLGERRARVAAGVARTLELDAVLPSPLDVLDHRVVATMTTRDANVRDVRPLVDLVGATDLKVTGADVLYASGPGTVRLVVRNSLRGDPVAGAALDLRLVDTTGRVLAEAGGVSDPAGTASLVLDVPLDAPSSAQLVAESRTALSTDRTTIDVSVRSRLAAQVMCDLPIHRPGDDAGVRALVVEQPSGHPAAGRDVEFELSCDGRVLGARAAARTDSFGVASATLRAPAGVPPSDCRVSVLAERKQIASVPLRVERFEVPTFQVSVAPSSPRWAPGRELPVTVTCSRFDGRPLADAAVRVELRAPSGASGPLFSWEGRTDARGEAGVAITAAREDVEAAHGVALVVAARDAGGREVRSRTAVVAAPSADEAAKIRVLTPDGPLVPGRPGRVLLLTSREPGSPLDVTVGARSPSPCVVDEFGVVEVRIDAVQADEAIVAGGSPVRLSVSRPPVALSVDRRVVAAGGEIAFRVVTTRTTDAAYVDLVRDGTIVATQTVPMDGHAGAGAFAVPEGVAGPVALHAYLIGREIADRTGVVGDARAVLVVPREELRANVTASRAEVGPGEELALAVDVKDAAGGGVPVVLAVRVADEAVLSLAAADPECTRMMLALDDSVRRAPGRIGGLSAAAVASLAATRDLTSPERNVADALFAILDRAVSYALDEVTLPARIAAYPARVAGVLQSTWTKTALTLRDVLVGPLAPSPGGAVTDVVQALAAAEAAGAFGADGLVDPWGGPLSLDLGTGDLRASSAGPDAVGGTDDDCSVSLDPDATRRLHEDWYAAHGVSFDAAAYQAAFLSRRAGFGGAGGGGMGQGGGGGAGGSSRSAADPAPVRMRRFFPAALLWAPATVTDDAGRATFNLRAPDSLTTWRVDVVASDARGHAADATTSFVTSQAFAVESDPPLSMFVGDEVEVPAIVRWGSDEPATASVEAEVSREGTLLSPAAFDLALGGRGDAVSPIRIRADVPGAMSLRLRASAGTRRDAVERVILVRAAGRDVVRTRGLAIGPKSATVVIERPDDATAGADRVELRVAASPVAAVLGGVDGLLQKPHGCFEQTSSTLYPDVLALLYLERAGRPDADVVEKFRDAIGEGVGRLLSFEIAGGGFDWFGHPPAKPLLTAYGLHEWVDIARVRPSARAVERRTAAWLASLQREDGSFPLESAPYHWTAQEKGANAATAYMSWALARADGGAASARRALDWLRPRLGAETDPYALALAAAALAEMDRTDDDSLAAASRLASMFRRDGAAARLDAPGGTALYGRRGPASVEATAVAALVALRLARPDVLPAEPLLAALVQDRGADGTWGTTQATVLALRALLEADAGTAVAATKLRLRSGDAVRVVEIAPSERDTVRIVDLSDFCTAEPAAVLEASCDGGDVSATLSLRSVVPFGASQASQSPLRLTATPDRKSCGSGDLVSIAIRLESSDEAPVAMPIVEVPLAAGFTADAASLDALRHVAGVERVESDSRSVVVYLRELTRASAFEATLGVRPRVRGRITAAPASAMPYYEPDAGVHAAAATFTVE